MVEYNDSIINSNAAVDDVTYRIVSHTEYLLPTYSVLVFILQ